MPMRLLLLLALVPILSAVADERPRPWSCPETVFVTGNNVAANEFRDKFRTNRTDFRLVQKQADAASVLDAALDKETISATLTLKSGDLVWSGNVSTSDFPGVIVAIRSLMVGRLIESMGLTACGKRSIH